MEQQQTALAFDAATQTFKASTGAIAQTSVYRAYPGSQANETDVDEEVVALNQNVAAQFTTSDVRRNYRYRRRLAQEPASVFQARYVIRR